MAALLTLTVNTRGYQVSFCLLWFIIMDIWCAAFIRKIFSKCCKADCLPYASFSLEMHISEHKCTTVNVSVLYNCIRYSTVTVGLAEPDSE